MNSFYVDVEGFDQLTGQIKKLTDDQRKKKEIIAILRRVSKPTLTAAKQFVPVQKSYSNIKSRRTVRGGGLRQSLGVIVGKKGNSKINPTIYIGPRVFKGKKFKRQGRNVFGDGWYGAMVDQGHDIYRNPTIRSYERKDGSRRVASLKRVTSKGQQNVVQGRVEGAFFMSKAHQSTKGTVTKDSESSVAKYFQTRINALSK
jgi:hypothetical protein